jgi:hypothetical protein
MRYSPRTCDLAVARPFVEWSIFTFNDQSKVSHEAEAEAEPVIYWQFSIPKLNYLFCKYKTLHPSDSTALQPARFKSICSLRLITPTKTISSQIMLLQKGNGLIRQPQIWHHRSVKLCSS